jgi:hypothetical protein
VEDLSPEVRLVLQAVMIEGMETLRVKEEWLEDLRKQCQSGKGGQVIVLLQGPESFQSILRSQLSNFTWEHSCKLVVISVETPKRGSMKVRAKTKDLSLKQEFSLGILNLSSRFVLSHAMVGGVVDHSWTFETNKRLSDCQLSMVERSSGVLASVSDFLSTTEVGKFVKVPRKEVPRSLQWKQRRAEVQARCAFSNSGWVQRMITTTELMLMYDIGVKEGNVMLEAIKKAGVEFPTAFTQQVPVRVLLRSFEILNEVEDGEVGRKEMMVIDPVAYEEQRKGESEFKTDNSILERKLVADYEKNAPGGNKVAVEVLKRAAKNDDAQVYAHDWNNRVCVGLNIVYCAAIHGGALDALRRLLLRRYRSCRSGIIRSFKRSMISEYGPEWLRTMQLARKKRRGNNKDIVLDYEVGLDAIHRGLAASF